MKIKIHQNLWDAAKAVLGEDFFLLNILFFHCPVVGLSWHMPHVCFIWICILQFSSIEFINVNKIKLIEYDFSQLLYSLISSLPIQLLRERYRNLQTWLWIFPVSSILSVFCFTHFEVFLFSVCTLRIFMCSWWIILFTLTKNLSLLLITFLSCILYFMMLF